MIKFNYKLNMELFKNFKFCYNLFLLFISVILIFSFYDFFGLHLNRYYPDLFPYNCPYYLTRENFINCQSKKFLYQIIWKENGIIENLQILFLLITIIMIVYILYKKKLHNHKIIKYFFILKLIGVTFIFFEEISWFQHIFDFKTPKLIESINYQNEFNLHNTSRVFNEIPRTLVLLWCCLSGVVYFLNKRIQNEEIKLIFKISQKIIILSIVLILFTLPYLIIDKLNLLNWNELHLNYAGNPFRVGMFVHMIWSPVVSEGFNFKQFLYIILSSSYFRFSELQELIFYYYFLMHLYLLNLYINK